MSVVRRKTRKVIVGDRQHGFVGIGGDVPVALQTMTSTYTYDIDTTVRQINALHAWAEPTWFAWRFRTSRTPLCSRRSSIR